MADSRSWQNYSNLAPYYDQKWEKYLHHTHLHLLNELETYPNSTILDISAGTGLLQTRFKHRGIEFDHMYLNDPAEGMLSVAKHRFSNDPRFHFSSFPAQNLEFPDQTFDVIICLNAFHNYSEQEAAIQEMYRVLKPGGRLYILDWNRSGLFIPVNFLIDLMTKELILTRSAPEVSTMLRDHSFEVKKCREWWFRYWKFFLIWAQKPHSI